MPALPGAHGSLKDTGGTGDASFTLPGPNAPVEVTVLDRYRGTTGNKLIVGLSTMVDAAVYGTWMLDWDGVKQVTLSSRDRVTTDGLLEFDDFFSGVAATSVSDTPEVCITGHGGVSTCSTADTTLSALALTAGGNAVALDQTFAAATTTYTASVANDVTAVTVTATATDSNASVAIDPADDDTSASGHQVDLDVGENTITTTVTNRGQTQDYTITVTRSAPVAVLWSATLTVGKGTSYWGYDTLRTPNYGRATVGTFDVPEGAGEATVAQVTWANDLMAFEVLSYPNAAAADWENRALHVAGVEFGFAAADGAVLSFIPSLPDRAAIGITYGSTAYPEGPNGPAAGRRIPVCLTSGGASCTVTDTGLSALSLTDADSTAVTLDPTFSSGIGVYEAEVANAVSTVTVAATASAAGATVAITPTDADAGTAGHQVDLSVDENTITVTVTNGGVSEDHTVTVTREAAPEAFVWQATLTAGEATGYEGYCASLCPVPAPGGHGTLADAAGGGSDASFTVPGPDVEVEMTALTRLDNKLHLALSTTLDAAVYGTWTLDWDGVKQVTLSSRDRVTTDGILEFDDFFSGSGIRGVRENDAVEVCITGHGGVSTCTAPDATLSALGVSETDGTAVTLDPAVFAAATTEYTASVANDVETVTVTATATDSGASVAFDPATDADTSTNGHQIDLDVGENTITATVTNGAAIQDYTVTVTREAAATAAVLWSATLTVGQGTSFRGYDTLRTPNYGRATDGTFDCAGRRRRGDGGPGYMGQ